MITGEEEGIVAMEGMQSIQINVIIIFFQNRFTIFVIMFQTANSLEKFVNDWGKRIAIIFDIFAKFLQSFICFEKFVNDFGKIAFMLKNSLTILENCIR